jgi:PAS domain S-box-containing protein
MMDGVPTQATSKGPQASDLATAIRRIAELETATSKPQQEALDIQKRLQQLVEHIPRVFWLYDCVADQITYVSPAYERVWGRAAPELYQNFSDWFDAIHDDDRQRVCSAFVSKASTGHYDESFRIVRPDGKVRWIQDRGYPVHDSEGKTHCIVGVAEDATELRRAQLQKLKAANSATTTQLLTGIADESHHSLQANQICLHRLRDLLEGLSGRPENLPEALDLIDEIQSAQGHLHGLYHQVRRYALPAKLRRSPCNLQGILEESWNQSVGLRESQLWQGSTEIDLICEVDRGLIDVAFRYLIENALESTADPLELQIVWSEGDIFDRPALQVSLRDNGHEFPPGQAHRAFEPFYSSGGLSMAIVERIIEGHGGEIHAVEHSGPGREICITLPRKIP